MSGGFQNIDPHPLTTRRVGGRTRKGEREWGVSSSEDARHCSVLNIYKYFVLHGIPCLYLHTPGLFHTQRMSGRISSLKLSFKKKKTPFSCYLSFLKGIPCFYWQAPELFHTYRMSGRISSWHAYISIRLNATIGYSIYKLRLHGRRGGGGRPHPVHLERHRYKIGLQHNNFYCCCFFVRCADLLLCYTVFWGAIIFE